MNVKFLDVTLRLYAPIPYDGEFIEWQTEVGFVDEWRPPWQALLGQVGFLNRFTVTMHRGAQAIAIEDYNHFDEKYGSIVQEAAGTKAARLPPDPDRSGIVSMTPKSLTEPETVCT